MNDPWDVKSVRKPGQYISCMKINGVPLLPPVLSKECRKEMQYYKLLAKEVEMRISYLKTQVESDSDSDKEKTDAPEISECELAYESSQDDHAIEIKANVGDASEQIISPLNSPKLVKDLSFNGKNNNRVETPKIPPLCSPPDIPERDYNHSPRKKEMMMEFETIQKHDKKANSTEPTFSFSDNYDDNDDSDPFTDMSVKQEGPSSLSCKSFTGSLIDLHTESVKDSQDLPKLIRQRSYTVLKPSPQLLAHLEVQSLRSGIDMSCFSMSESVSNLSTPNKKRRSWDLETAKVQWSTMALELRQKNMKILKNEELKAHNSRPNKKFNTSPPRGKSVSQDKHRRGSLTANKTSPKSEPTKGKKVPSPVQSAPTNRTVVKEPISPQNTNKKIGPPKHTSITSDHVSTDDPAAKVRELYERIQKQQLQQMASLIEKQKKEQMMLQQVFEEQNSLLCKQLKTICPKSPVEAKEAWVEKSKLSDQGPVSLSQLINYRAPESKSFDSPLCTALTDTNKYLSQCENVLKKSRDITGSLKKQEGRAGSHGQSTNKKSPQPHSQSDGSITRTHSPNRSSISRRLKYDDDPTLTDRTNDTFADLNVTFPSDTSECSTVNNNNNNNTVLNLPEKQNTFIQDKPTKFSNNSELTDQAITNMVETLQNSVRNTRVKNSSLNYRPTVKEITAACYSLHDTFITSTPPERCSMIAADRTRRRVLANRPSPRIHRNTDSERQ